MTTVRKTITIKEDLESTIQKLRGEMISQGLDLSFSTTMNIVVVSGLVGCEKFDQEIWAEIADFFEEAPEDEEEIEKIIKPYKDFLLSKLKRLKKEHKL